ncbi:aldo/keto reductase [Planctomicrobium sp. SH664]|uniref:aldo/keto reductase n=1 Tax=Planctomicrobium sp. SH664 TaxID=3448125 RepID=UPI003F5BFDE0
MASSRTARRDFLKTSAAALTLAATSPWQFGGMALAAEGKGVERRRFGKTDMEVGVLGFGGAEIGYNKVDQDTVTKLLNGAIDSGLNVIDTAECYVDSEVLIGNAVGNRRKDYFLFTKCGHAPEAKGWTKDAILRSVERSLKRLKTDAVDLVNLHSCSLDELMKGECIEALEQAKKEGKTRYIGYSGDAKAARYAVECGRFDALQTSLNICDQEAIELTLPIARDREMGVICKRPIANAVWRNEKPPQSNYHLEYWNRLQDLKYDFAMGEAAKEQGPNGPAATAMRFTAMQPGVHVLIVGTTKPERWKENAELISAGPLPAEVEKSIRNRWKEVAKNTWTGQT